MKSKNDAISMESMTDLIQYIFSWVIMLPTAVIISGKMLMFPIRFATDTQQKLKLNLGIFVVEATGGEVILGFTGVFGTFFLVAVFAGKWAYAVVKNNFGIDPGQFHAICFFSALMTVIWSFFLFLIYLLVNRAPGSSFVDSEAEYKRRIEKLAVKPRASAGAARKKNEKS